MLVGAFTVGGLSNCSQSESSIAVSLAVSSTLLPSLRARCISCRLAGVRRGLHELPRFLDHPRGDPSWHPLGLVLLAFPENRAAVLVAQPADQLPAEALAIRLDDIAGGGHSHPQPPTSGEVQRLGRGRKKKLGAVHAVIVIAPVAWKLMVALTVSSIAAVIATLVGNAVQETCPSPKSSVAVAVPPSKASPVTVA